MKFFQEFRPAMSLLLWFTLLCGLVYPAVVTLAAQGLFKHQAQGSLIAGAADSVRGSALVGQPFSEPRFFWGRLSATGGQPFNGAASSGSNLGPLNPALIDAVKARIEALRAADPGQTAPIPVDLVTASASGLDPHISPAAAAWQVPRVARARGLDDAKIRELVAAHTEGRDFGVLGEPRVNVLTLNLALEAVR